ncbi:hypothetical protein A6M21_02375 [Desulfotomaculum copahuensis]|uniref:Uncharacterized protein n=1 Tax=Desulfotomaculum copahuensis TaxID=1838280 RepID=A0A1B7LJE1_9FIRM|nr:hypothetical protein A6M21_02375 [Desulfotomaculum copahuensis]
MTWVAVLKFNDTGVLKIICREMAMSKGGGCARASFLCVPGRRRPPEGGFISSFDSLLSPAVY